MKSKASITAHNHFKATLIDAKTGKVKQVTEAFNLVTDYWYQQLLENNSSDGFHYLFLGTGGGGVSKPSPSDTSLFQFLAYKQVTWSIYSIKKDGLCVRKGSVSFSETEAIGNLTEIGLNANYDTRSSRLGTHAMFTDGEGNQIEIPKTNADRLFIEITIYGRIQFTGKLKPLRPIDSVYAPSFSPMVSEKYDYDVTGSFLPKWAWLALGWNSAYSAFVSYNNVGFYGITHPVYRGNGVNCFITASQAAYAMKDGNHYRQTSVQIPSTTGNLEQTYLIKSISSTTLDAYISFPDHSIYEPRTFTFNLTAADEQTDFNLDIPELMKTGVIVKVNGQAKQEGVDFDWSGKNFEMEQAWISADNRYIIDHPVLPSFNNGTTGTYAFPFWRTSGKHYITSNTGPQDWVYDFESPVPVNTLKRTYTYLYTGSPTVVLSYSSDGSTWKEAATIEPSEEATRVFDKIEARYWKLHFSSIPTNQYNETQYSPSAMFDFVEPGLKFKSPLKQGDAVEVQAKCEYPIKNENWIIENVVFDVDFARGDAT